jgi:2-dehydro-3-deoxyphosphooctonate aldolase (KDO 8-P synthase)
MKKLILMAGPCAIEDRDTPIAIAEYLLAMTRDLDIDLIFKSSWKKANRTSLNSFTGASKEDALYVFDWVRGEIGAKVITDIHESPDAAEIAPHVDYLQIPAFLCRQTDLLIAAGETGLPVNIKKAQFSSPESMKFAVEKVYSTGNKEVLLTERGTTFGYNNLVVDFTSIPTMKSLGVPVIMDATHCLQKPNQTAGVTGGSPHLIGTMCYAGIASGADGLFVETHPNPAAAKSDSASMLQMDKLEEILLKALKIKSVI